MEKDLAVLYQKFHIGKMELKNRIVMAPMHTKLASETGEVTDRMLAFLIERAKGGVGLIVLENTCIDWAYGRAAGNPVGIYDDLNRTGLSNIALAVHRYGCKIVTQLHHTGRQNLRSNIEGHKAPLAPSPIKSKVGGDEPRSLSESEIYCIIQQYVDGARRSKDAGFDGVELHGAHGYLLTQFFSPYTNRRDDKWGGSFNNRARFLIEVVKKIRQEVGPEFPILYRLSAEERIPGGTTLEDTLRLIPLLEEAGVDCFDVSAGIYDSIEWIYTLQGVTPGSLLPLAEAVKRNTSKPVIGVSRLGWDLTIAAKAVQENKVDLVAIGRSLLADPNLPQKYYEGNEKEITPCIACNECVAMENRGWHIHCVTNPNLGVEYLKLLQPTNKKKRVLVIGGGPSGMQCAFTAASRGHQVTLVEKEKDLGGQTRAAAVAAYKSKELNTFRKYLETMLLKHDVIIHLEKEVKTPQDITGDFDVIILAVGAKPVLPRIEGVENVKTAFDVLLTKGETVGKKVVVIGASGVGLDCALFLKENKERDVIVVEQREEIAQDMNEFLKRHVLSLAEKAGLEFRTNWKAVRAEQGRLIGRGLLADEIIECDSVIAATGFKSYDCEMLKNAFENNGSQVRVVGSAIESGEIFEATQTGFWAGIEI